MNFLRLHAYTVMTDAVIKCHHKIFLLSFVGTSCLGTLLTYWLNWPINNPINGYQAALTHPSRRLWFLGEGHPLRRLPQISTSNPHFTGASSSILSQRSCWMLTCCATYISMKSSYSCTVGSDVEIIANSRCSEDLKYNFSLQYSQGCCISA